MAHVLRHKTTQAQVPRQQLSQRARAVAIQRSQLLATTTEDHDQWVQDAAAENPFLEADLDASIIEDGVGLGCFATDPRERWAETGDGNATVLDDADIVLDDASGGDMIPQESARFWTGSILGEHIERIAAAPASLFSLVHRQISLEFTDKLDLEIAELILGELEDGFLPADISVQISTRTGADLDRVERVLGVMQTFDPPGVCARSQIEAIEIRLREIGEMTPEFEKVLRNLRRLTRSADRKGLARACGLQDSELGEILSRLGKFASRPGVDEGVPPTRIPDLKVVWGGGRKLEAIMHPHAARRLVFDEDFQGQRGQTGIGPMRRQARVLVDEDALFRTRLELVGTTLARLQERYLFSKSDRPAPLTQQHLAAKTGLTEPEISRAVKNRTIDTPRGLIEMQALFARPHELDDAIVRLFHSLPRPSDRAIHAELLEQGFTASPRTVSNRKRALGLDSRLVSARRRRERQEFHRHAE